MFNVLPPVPLSVTVIFFICFGCLRKILESELFVVKKIEGKFIEEIKTKLSKNNISNNQIKMTKKKIKKPNKTVDLNDINNKILEIYKSNKNQIFKTKITKADIIKPAD